ncbi:hypothetical protein BDR05DRAFT_869091 [Suillus weaverae]|nr:hypothetical protein BDR05DRAFT_869091 [Suillus weaverae]
MSTLNASTGYTPFHLHLGRTPHMLPPLTPDRIQAAHEDFPTNIANALEAIMSLKTDITDAHDALLASQVAQANAANAHRSNEPSFKIGDFVYLSTAHR